MRKLVFVIGLFLLISGCASTPETLDPGVIQTAIVQTEKAKPSYTPTIELINTPIPTETPQATQTESPTPTSSPTPDLRVIDEDPYKFLLTKNDLPKESRYYLPNEWWISPHRNSEVVSGWGVDEGRKYLETTGRVDGWVASYARGSKTHTAPEEIYDNVVMYKTSEGASLVINDFSSCADPSSNFTEIKTDLLIGDHTRVCIQKEMQSSGENRVWYRIEFTYRNFYHAVVGWGWENDIEPEFIETVARTLLEKLQAAPLTDKVIFTP